MPRRVRQKPSLLAPVGNLIRSLSDTDRRLRRRVLRGSLWGLSVLFAWSLLIGTYSLPRIFRLNMEKSGLIESNRELTVRLIDAVRVRDMLKGDPVYIERIARTRYFMVRSNETIYRYRSR